MLQLLNKDMDTSLATILAIITGAVLTINGAAVSVDTLINGATSATNAANVHQLATALQVYYLENQSYPNVSGGEALVSALFAKGFLKTVPSDASIFSYEVKDDGQDYSLALTQ